MRLFFCITLILFSSFLFAQGEANYWYFGSNAGLDFNSGTAVAITDGALNTNEGCSTISDSNGDLLFYTDGIRVWDKNHNTMPNGFGLMGDPSSTQSGIIVPKPNDPNIYFIFTVAQLGLSSGLRYSEVDLTLNGGNGDITSNKNIPLFTPSTEKITAIQHANGVDYWVIAHKWNSNEFLSYKITESGVEITPTITPIGSVHNGDPAETIGYMKVSPDGQKLALAKWHNTAFVEIFDFNSQNGQFSNAINLSDMFYNGLQSGPYGLEFSPNSEMLYVSDTDFISTRFKIHQFNLMHGNQMDIANSDVILYDGTDSVSALQLAIDEKIYIANAYSGYLDVIENPNEPGLSSGYVNRALFLEGRQAIYGLPPFIQSFFQVGINVEFTCVGDETQFSVNSSQEIANIQWDFGDGNTTSEVTPTHVYTSAGTYPVTVSVNSVSGTNRFFTTDIVIHDVPIANEVSNYHLCDDSTNDDVEIFDLSTKDSEVLGTQSDVFFDIRYYASMEDAQNHENELTISYANISNSQTIYVKIYNVDNTDCYDITSFDLIVDTMPVANTVIDLMVCDDVSNDGTELVDLTQFNDDILNGQTAADFNISYHISQADAENDANPLPDDFQTVDNPQQVFIRIENVVNESCYDTGSFEIIIDEQPTAYQPDDMFLCDDLNDGEEAFNLSSQNNQVSNGQTGFNITYHLSQDDADDNQNPLTSPYTNETNPQQIFVRIENTNNSNCFDTTSFTIQVDAMPVVNVVADVTTCDDASNDGTELVDLTQFDNAVLNGQAASDFNITYHISQINAENSANPLPDDFQTVDNPQQVFIRIENVNNASCYETGSFQIIIDDYLEAYQPDDMYLCDALNDGEESFDLNLQNDQISNGQTGNFAITYHLSQADADLNENPLSIPYTNITNPQQIFARIENMENFDCYNTTSFYIEALETPDPDMETTYYFCTDETVVLDAGFGYDSYLWSTGETTQSIVVGSAGNYDVTVAYDYPTMPPLSCSFTETVQVIESDEAIINDIEIEDWTAYDNTITVEVSGIGDYEFSIDGINYQSSNVFNNLPVGEYTIYVRDQNGCGVVNEEVYVLYYPKFFTPNGDGDNDNWQVYFSQTEPDITVLIFDRYGKLLKQLNALSDGWDGTFNGEHMPTSDYWFVVNRPSKGKQYRAHFTLKR
ncbi:hypothetical protein C1T31_11470 [Hanstruepera neustonica]|uniref:PKD domain-containing protein n=1 Tax=Hanstruepera neustonica TaxID=1445657 RepID=A0A2K1DWK5_9FLAO|nr:T9SS type B sorting domain-containing protein [Hanstruepera neustonica]PNQ72408.1 hypothetical protein C1T31_11470 [Hanstruepera neustonica]